MNFPDECEETLRNPRIPLKEKKRKITFINNSKSAIRKIRIDNCVITEGLRCDWLVIDESMIEYFVELKGSDVKHAVKQLTTSIEKVSQDKRRQKKYCFIVSSRIPKTGTDILKWKKEFKRDFNAVFNLKNNQMEHTI